MSFAVALESASKIYARDVMALSPINVRIGEDEMVALLGPSGCGKSTCLRLMAGLERPSTGQVLWPQARPRTGFVFQEPTLMPWLEARDNVALPLALVRRPLHERRAEAERALDAVGLSGFARALPNELSGGMKMRVSLARALSVRPTLLLLDEPFAALDELTREDLNDQLLTLHASMPFAGVFVTHSVYESVYLADRIIVLSPRPGRIIAEFTQSQPRPRPPGFRASQPYLDLCAQVSKAIRAGLKDAA